MKNKTILGIWCTKQNCMFIDSKHIQIELVVNIWYSYDNDSKTNVINKKLCFVKEIDLNDLNDEVEIIEEPQEHKMPEKIFLNQTDGTCYMDLYSYKQVPLKRKKLSLEEVSIINKINEILDYLEENNE